MRQHLKGESGVALITVLLVLMLAAGLTAGMVAALVSDQRSHGIDRDQSRAYAAAHAGLEKLTTQLAQLFSTDVSPSGAQITQAAATAPSIYGFNFVAPGGGSGYKIDFIADPCASCPNKGNPLPSASNDITTGPFTGFKGIITPYTLTVTATSASGSEVRLRREVQTVAVPVFQFGIFGERSLSFHAGANFDFGGRVHTNENLFLAEGSGATLTFRDKLTAVGEVVRAELENTNAITNSGHTGTVVVPTVVGSSYRNLAASEGSVLGGPTSAKWNGWENLSKNTYQTNIRNTLTGAKRLDLPLVSQGAAPIDLIRRPVVNSNEDVNQPAVFGQRYFSQASLRILISDRAADLTGLPTITAGAPIQLDGNWIAAPPAGYAVGLNRPPLARAIGNAAGNTTTISGTASTYAAPYHQLNVVAVPTGMLIPNLVVGGNNIICTGKTASTFTGCNVPANIPVGTVVSATTPAGNAVATTTTGAVVTAGNPKTITVVANSTLPFAHDFAWISDRTNNRPTPMTCEGYDTATNPDRLLNCRILGVTNAQTTAGRTISMYSAAPANTSLIGGFIKIERQNNPPPVGAGGWTDVTLEILNLGFAAPNQEGTICADPTPDAVIRFQRLRDNGGSCAYANSIDSRDYWPNVLFDNREGYYRLQPTTSLNMDMGGVMNYISIDVANLRRWFAGQIGATGAQALNNNGFIVYFSDRRGDHQDASAGAPERGWFANEDSVNPADAASSAANGVLDGGEDRNENRPQNPLPETWGATPSALALYGANAPFDATSNPLTAIINPQARVNRQVFFRRALKLINGGIVGGVNNLPNPGLTVTSENGAYVQGNYNATDTSVTGAEGRPAAILADAITILSNSWSDVKSLNSPNDVGGRVATTTGYRFAMVAGKSIPFTRPGWGAQDMGTDGGVHNFLRMLEDWGGQTARYRGSMVSLYTARQMIGIYRADDNVYSPPAREFSFDTNFLNPVLLPPGTPMFRDVNTLRFRQILRPNQ
jgi:hypothetical protein